MGLLIILGYFAVSVIAFFTGFALTFEVLSAVDIKMSEGALRWVRRLVFVTANLSGVAGFWLFQGPSSSEAGADAFYMLPLGLIGLAIGLFLALSKRPK